MSNLHLPDSNNLATSKVDGEKMRATPKQYCRSDQQIEGDRMMKKIQEARDALIIVREKLMGLQFDSISPEELSGTVQVSEIRIAQIKSRIKSTRYLLESSRIPFDQLEHANYRTIEELIQRKNESIDLLLKAKEEIQDSESLQPSLQQLACKYRYRSSYFAVDPRTDQITLNEVPAKAMQQIQSHLDEKISFTASQRDAYVAVLSSGRTGIDPGALLFAPDKTTVAYTVGKHGGHYRPKKTCTGALNSTGMIVLPNSVLPHALMHEYAHFEDEMFYGEDRGQFEQLIGEIYSIIREVPEESFSQESHQVFEHIKSELLSNYLIEGSRYNPASMTLEQAREILLAAIDTVRRMFEFGFAKEVVSSILMHSLSFEDVLQWRNVDDDEMRRIARQKNNV